MQSVAGTLLEDTVVNVGVAVGPGVAVAFGAEVGVGVGALFGDAVDPGVGVAVGSTPAVGVLVAFWGTPAILVSGTRLVCGDAPPPHADTNKLAKRGARRTKVRPVIRISYTFGCVIC